MKRLGKERDGSAVGAGSASTGTLSCCTSDEVHLLYFPPGKGKSEHATFSPWSGSIATAEVSPPVLSACLILTGFGLELSLVYSAQSIWADIFSSATCILFSSCHLV